MLSFTLAQHRSRDGLKIIAICLLVLGILVILSLGTVKITDESILDKEIKYLKGIGEPVTRAEIAPSQIPEDRNSAVLYREAMEKLKVADDVSEIFGSLSISESEGSAEDLEKVKQTIKQNAEVLRLMKVAGKFPHHRDTLIPDIEGVLKLFRFLNGTTTLWYTEGKIGRALDLWLQTFLWISRRKKGTFLFNALLSFALARQNLYTLERIVSDLEGTYPVYRAIENALLDELATHRSQMVNTLRLTRAFILDARGNVETVAPHFKKRPEELLHLLVAKFARGRDLARYSRITQECIRQFQKPWYKADLAGLERMLTEIPWYCFLTRKIRDSLNSYIRSEKYIAHVQLARLAIRLKGWKATKGGYPKGLEELGLAPEYITDPFSGEGLIYRTRGDGFIIYSVGVNQEDDGGICTGDKDKDIVWESRR